MFIKRIERVVMKYRGIIFDLDGVICHTDKYHYKAWKEIADKLDIHFDEEINNRLRGVSRMESFEIILENYNGELSQEEKEKHTNDKNEVYKVLLNEMSEKDLDDKVKNTLIELKNRGIKLAIGSSSKNAKFILNQIGIYDLFDAISDGNNITQSKPHPEVFLKAGEMINIEPEYCLVIEDAVAGVEAAISAKMDSVAIGDATKANIATYNINSFDEILGL